MFLTTDRGLKIHVHSTEAVEATVKLLQSKKDQIRQPVFLHANLFAGPNMPEDAVLVDPILFKVNKHE